MRTRCVLNDLVNEPDIVVSVDGQDVADGTGVVDFGQTSKGTPVFKTFVVSNQGAVPLSLYEPITVPEGFQLVSGFGSSTLVAGQSTTFVLQLTGQIVGQSSGQIRFGTNDPDESVFDFAVGGEVTESACPNTDH